MPIVVPAQLHPEMIVNWMKITQRSTGTLLYPMNLFFEVSNVLFLLQMNPLTLIFYKQIILGKNIPSKEDNKNNLTVFLIVIASHSDVHIGRRGNLQSK